MYLSAAQVPQKRSNSAGREAEQRMISARDSVLRWFVAFTFRFKRSDSVSESPNVNQSIVSISSTEGSEPGSPPTAGGANQFSPARNKEYLYDASDVIRKVLFSTRSNIRLLHEVLRQVRLHCNVLVLQTSFSGLNPKYTNNHKLSPLPIYM